MTIAKGWASVVGHKIPMVVGGTTIVIAPLRVFECAVGEACLGGLASATKCEFGHRGELCGYCAEKNSTSAGFKKSDRDQFCSACQDWSAAGGVAVLVLIVLAIVFALHVHHWYGATIIAREVAENVEEHQTEDIQNFVKELLEICSAIKIKETGRITVRA